MSFVRRECAARYDDRAEAGQFAGPVDVTGKYLAGILICDDCAYATIAPDNFQGLAEIIGDASIGRYPDRPARS